MCIRASLSAEGAEPVVFEIAKNRRGPFRGIAVDSQTKAPIPFLKMSLKTKEKYIAGERGRGEAVRCEVETDAQGYFAVEESMCGGVCTVTTLDGDLRPGPASFDLLIPEDPAEAEPITVAFEGSPTYRIETTTREALSGSFLFALAEDESRTLSKSPLRFHGSRAWCSPPRPPEKYRAKHLLAIGSPDGHRFGIQRAPWKAAQSNEPLTFQVKSVASLKLDVSLESAAQGTSSMRPQRNLQITPWEDVAPPLAQKWRIHQRQYLPPGSVGISAWTREHERIDTEAYLSPGKRTDVALHLFLPTDFVTIRGRVVHASGKPLPTLGISLAVGPGKREWDVSYPSTPLACGNGIDHYLDAGLTLIHISEPTRPY